MSRAILLLAVLLGSTAAWGIEPCCNVSAVDAKTGLVSVKNIKTRKILRYQDRGAHPALTLRVAARPPGRGH